MIELLALVLGLTASAAERVPTFAGSAAQVDAASDAAEGAELETMTRRVASQLRCPVCQGLSIEDSPTELAQNMRSVVREQLAEGRTPEQVKAYFVSRYGEWILLAPEPRGFNLMVYLLPLAAVLAGAVIVAVAIRRWSGRPLAAARTDAMPIDEPELEPWEDSS